jgi:Xaa-Pro aminopeptidase
MHMNEPRTCEYMDSCELDALIVQTPANVAYVTGFRWWLAPVFREYMVAPGGSGDLVQRSFAVYTPGSRPALVLEPYMVVNAEELEAEVWVAGAAPYEGGGGSGELVELLRRAPAGATPVEALAAALSARGLADGRIGLEVDGLPPQVHAELQDRLPKAELLDCTSLLRLVRAVKTEAEIALLARSAEIAEEAAGQAFALAAPGRSLAELVQAFRLRAAERGAALDHFALSPDGVGIAMDTRHTLRAGDVHFADFGCIYRGYYSDSGTTLAIGEPSPRALELHGAVRDAIAAGADALRPGAAASSVQVTMQALLAEQGITGTYPHGHGFGLDVRDYPILAPANGRRIRDGCIDVSSDLALEEGMVVNLEAPIFTLGTGSVHCERSFVITAGGSRPLALQDRSAPVQPAAEDGG